MSVHARFIQLHEQLSRSVIGQQALTERLLVVLLADGHLLVEGAPGLAKTRAIQSLARQLEVSFQRIQFTPDLLPADLTGTEVFRPQTGEFAFRPGPLFSHFVLADEINRAPAKVQSALLEAMAERQVTAGGKTRPLPEVFLVMATQNPLEQEGTYPLPEAQLDRFLLHAWVGYPDAEQELAIMRLVRSEQQVQPAATESPLTRDAILEARRAVQQVHLAEPLERYIVDLVQATRHAGRYDAQLGRYIQLGASPRACLALDRCARARAWLKGRQEVLPEDIRELAPDVLRHRLLLSYEADAEAVRADAVIQRLLSLVALA
ncbi:AAA family ATPase [Marinospirillum alkaliphilum]|uniref:MoxR-like ATPase n=1 Tax=Marinospirillum alkaliphilum DSM 21637 TaxID=1122209 RepID=A0A1K1YG22_9GAMM|nr:MoxR family ATPase [Marinospirillum alkaliphilum]SFX60702.1 MoxR-like ATPase [Marinospirillum alkaliphilum DSM 21637]